MKVIKKMFQVTLLTAILFMVQNAQAQRGQHHKGGNMLEKIKTELNLTVEQETKITAIQEKYRPQMETLKAQENEDRNEKRAAFKDLMKAQKEEVSQVLTEDQKAIIKEKQDQRKDNHKEHRAERKEAHKAIKAYKTEHIHPVILEQRVKLEQDISAEDKAKIADLRATFKQLKEDKKASKKEFSKKKMKEEDRNKEEMMAERKAIKEQYKAEFETLDALNEKYSTQIDALHEAIKPQQEQWKKDMKAIHKKYASPNENMDREHPRKGKEGHRKGHKKGKMGHHDMGKKHFLLLDPNEKPAPISANTQAFTTLKSYPNPAINSSTLTYEVTKATRIKIALTDESGHAIKVLVNEFKEVGAYQMNVDLSGLKSGAYYYTVTDNGGVTSAKIVVNK